MMTELEKLAADAMREAGLNPCKYGHVDWRLLGGTNCGCHKDAVCSVPVYGCDYCNDSDYGNNMEAEQQRSLCLDMFGPWNDED